MRMLGRPKGLSPRDEECGCGVPAAAAEQVEQAAPDVVRSQHGEDGVNRRRRCPAHRDRAPYAQRWTLLDVMEPVVPVVPGQGVRLGNRHGAVPADHQHSPACGAGRAAEAEPRQRVGSDGARREQQRTENGQASNYSHGGGICLSELQPPTRDLIRRAHALADEMGHPLVGTEHLLLAMVRADENIAAHRILVETDSLSAVEQQLTKIFGRLPGHR